MTIKMTEQDEARDKLRKMIPKGSTVYTILDHVSRSGMTRHIRVVVPYITSEGEIDFSHPNHAVGKALGYRQLPLGKGDGLVVSGCGMDMGFHLINSLSYALYDDGYAINHRWL